MASRNPDKVREVEEILAAASVEVVRGLDWPEVEETGETLEENAVMKARAVMEATGMAAVADDTGLEVAALQWGPGVRTARFAGPEASYEDNVAELLRRMEGVGDRRATFRSVVAMVTPDGEELIAEGILEGRIAEFPRGTYGFGYDPVFEVEGQTLSELSSEEKHAISHRAKALRALVARFGELGGG